MSTKKKDNLALWESVERTSLKYAKKVKEGEKGREYVAIDAYSQIKQATSQWGAYGSNWGLYDQNFIYNNLGQLVLHANFKYPDGSFPISSEIQLKNSKGYMVKDTHKKLTTDCITKSLSYLGFNADVFMGKFEDNKYIEGLKEVELEEETQATLAQQYKETKQKIIKYINDCDDVAKLNHYWQQVIDRKPLNKADYKKIHGIYKNQYNQLAESQNTDNYPLLD